MQSAVRRKTSLTLNAEALEAARDMGINVSAVAEEALLAAVAAARQEAWLKENADAFEAQARWHAENGHPLADILTGPGADTWRS